MQGQEYTKRGICGISDVRSSFILGNFQNPYGKQLHVILQGKKVIHARAIPLGCKYVIVFALSLTHSMCWQ